MPSADVPCTQLVKKRFADALQAQKFYSGRLCSKKAIFMQSLKHTPSMVARLLMRWLMQVGSAVSDHDASVPLQLYAHKLGACLLGCTGEQPCPAVDNMHRWVRELSSMIVCVSLSNPRGLRDFQTASIDGSQNPATVQELPDSFYEDLLVRTSVAIVLKMGTWLPCGLKLCLV